MNLDTDYFTLFGLPRTFMLDAAALDTAYRDIQSQVHPDRFVRASETERRIAMQWATRANEAYRMLKTPLSRARYLLTLSDCDIEAERNVVMSPDFLMEQMAWHEAVSEARQENDRQALDEIKARLQQDIDRRYAQLKPLIDSLPADPSLRPAAADAVRQLMFLDKLDQEIDDALFD